MKRAYVLGVPHTQANFSFTACAYTIKAINLCKMLKMIGYHVVFLGTAGSDAVKGVADEIIELTTQADFDQYCGHPGQDFFDISNTGRRQPYIDKWNATARAYFRDTAMKADKWTEIVCCPWGWGNHPQIEEVQHHQLVCESGIGYSDTFAKYRVFESYAWMHFHLGKEKRASGDAWKECVIPNSFDPQMFQNPSFEPIGNRQYFLYFGRLVESKGVRLAVEIAKRVNKPIILVGQGDGSDFIKQYDKATCRGPVGISGRADYMRHAIALIAPTRYVEPFGGVAVEAQLMGTPVISTDWGAFTETVLHGRTGFRCRTFDQFRRAAEEVVTLNPRECRVWAYANYTIDRVAGMYEEYFQQLLDYNRSGFYEEHPDRLNLKFMRKIYP